MRAGKSMPLDGPLAVVEHAWHPVHVHPGLLHPQVDIVADPEGHKANAAKLQSLREPVIPASTVPMSNNVRPHRPTNRLHPGHEHRVLGAALP